MRRLCDSPDGIWADRMQAPAAPGVHIHGQFLALQRPPDLMIESAASFAEGPN
jgi:hypothetical protein